LARKKRRKSTAKKTTAGRKTTRRRVKRKTTTTRRTVKRRRRRTVGGTVISRLEAKWYKGTIGGSKAWVDGLKDADSYEAYCMGISKKLGIPLATVKKSIPAKNWNDFRKNPQKYLKDFKTGVGIAHKLKKWSKGLKKAFSRTK